MIKFFVAMTLLKIFCIHKLFICFLNINFGAEYNYNTSTHYKQSDNNYSSSGRNLPSLIIEYYPACDFPETSDRSSYIFTVPQHQFTDEINDNQHATNLFNTSQNDNITQFIEESNNKMNSGDAKSETETTTSTKINYSVDANFCKKYYKTEGSHTNSYPQLSQSNSNNTEFINECHKYIDYMTSTQNYSQTYSVLNEKENSYFITDNYADSCFQQSKCYSEESLLHDHILEDNVSLGSTIGQSNYNNLCNSDYQLLNNISGSQFTAQNQSHSINNEMQNLYFSDQEYMSQVTQSQSHLTKR